MISFLPNSPGVYRLFDPKTLQSTSARFKDDLKMDFATMLPALDVDGASYIRAGGCGLTRLHGG